jgi:hypothetical protein
VGQAGKHAVGRFNRRLHAWLRAAPFCLGSDLQELLPDRSRIEALEEVSQCSANLFIDISP